MKITIFTEHNASMDSPEGKLAYPEGMNECLRLLIAGDGHEVTMIVHGPDDDGSELTEEMLKNTDVLVWWGHWYHGSVNPAVVDMVVDYVNRGMGMLALHSAHESRPMQRLMGTTGALSWREMGENERVWVIDKTHPVAQGLGDYIDIEHEEMYGEPFAIPAPDELVFISWFRGGEVMRSGCTFKRGFGKLFYFRPGHETLPTYHNEQIRRVILNALEYLKPARPVTTAPVKSFHAQTPPEKI